MKKPQYKVRNSTNSNNSVPFISYSNSPNFNMKLMGEHSQQH